MGDMHTLRGLVRTHDVRGRRTVLPDAHRNREVKATGTGPGFQ